MNEKLYYVRYSHGGLYENTKEQCKIFRFFKFSSYVLFCKLTVFLLVQYCNAFSYF
jgi:hypothetical protein